MILAIADGSPDLYLTKLRIARSASHVSNFLRDPFQLQPANCGMARSLNDMMIKDMKKDLHVLVAMPEEHQGQICF